MNFEDVADMVGELSAMKFFPNDKAGRLAVMKLVGSMAENPKQVRWLVDRMLVLFDEWPGPRTFRGVFCKKFKPRDGIDLRCIVTDKYPEGIPDEPRIEAPRLALPAGRQFSADPELEAVIGTAVQKLPKIADLPKHRPTAAEVRFGEHLQEIVTPPQDRELPQIEKPVQPVEIPPVGPDGRFVGSLLGNSGRITREDVDREVAKQRGGRA